MADIAIFRINYKSDFILTLNSDAGWLTPFCIKFWTGAPSQAYYAYYDGMSYTHCAPVEGEPTKLLVQFDDHHLTIGDLKFQIGYHFTVDDFPTTVEDEVINQASVIIEVDDAPAQVMLDLNGETAPEIEFSLPAYANESQRIANEEARIAAEQQRIANEEARISAETIRQQNEQQRIDQETARVNEFSTLKSQSQAATRDANAAATLANEKAQLAADKAALADDAATLAIQKAQLAADKAALANDAAQLAADKAALAQQKAEYAQQQGGYAKDQGDYAKNQGNYAKEQGEIAQADHERAEADHGIAVDDHTQAGNDHTRAESDHGIAVNDHTQAGNDHTRAESDHGIAVDDHTQAGNDHTRAEADHGIAADDHTQAGNDHTRAESDHTRAESDHAAVEVYVDSLGAFDISAYHATGGVLAKYADLTAALGTNGANIPEALRKGGMSVKYAQSSDNKYIQYRLTENSWSTKTIDWNEDNGESTTITYSDAKPNEYVSELYIVSPNGNKVNGIYVSFLQYNEEDGFTFSLSKNGAEIASTFRKKNLSAGDVVEMQIKDEAYSDYRFLFVYIGNTSVYGASGIYWSLTDNVFNLRCCPIIANFLTSKIGKVEVIDSIPTENSNNPVKSSGIYASINDTKTALETQIATKQDKPVVCDNANANKYIIEMYIEKGYREGLYLYSVQFGNGDRRFAIHDSNGLVAFVSKLSAVANTVYKFENDSITLYWVWSGQEGINVSGIYYNLTNNVKNILNWSTIYSYIQEHSGDEVVMNWTNNAQCNQHIKELYINPEYYVDGLKLKTIVVRQKSMSFMLYDSSNNLVYNNSCDWPTVPTINNEILYDDLMWPIYTGGVNGNLIGYIKFRYLNDNYGVSGINYTLTQSIVTNIDNSPTAKAVINAKDQFVMFGDSLIGQPLNTHNLMIPYLINKLKVPVYDIGCGGCRMSLRTPGATDYYDSFSFTKIVDAFISGELDENQQNPTGATSYVGQIRNLQLIDKTKNITAICEYLNNDFNSENLLGDYFVANTEEFDINSFDKQTVLGAMNYGVSKLLMNLPEIKLGMVNGAYTMANNGIEGLNDFQKIADGNKTLIDYQKAIFTNATKIGIPYVDMNNMPTGRNFFNLRMSQFNTVDGTHCNAYGFIQLAKVMVMAYEHISGNIIS